MNANILEEVTRENIMTKREKIISNHIKNVYPIKDYTTGGKTKYYTKLQPHKRGHEKKISSSNIDELYDKIIAHYLEIELREKFTVEDILEQAILDLTPLTATRHRQIFNKYFSALKSRKIASLTENDIRDALKEILDKGIKAKAFNNATSTLNKINDYCVYNHIDCINIREKVSEFRKCKMVGKKVFVYEHKKETELAFSEAEAIKLIKYALDNPDYINLAIALLITTGLRAGELLALTVFDVDLDKNYLNVNKMEKKSREIVSGCKDNSDRMVYLNQDAILIINKLFEVRNQDDADIDYLFLNPLSDDGKLHLRAMDNRLRKIQHVLNMTDELPERSPHDCRRTYASIQYLHGVDIKTIQNQLGHTKPQQTWDYIRDIVDIETRVNKLAQGCILA